MKMNSANMNLELLTGANRDLTSANGMMEQKKEVAGSSFETIMSQTQTSLSSKYQQTGSSNPVQVKNTSYKEVSKPSMNVSSNEVKAQADNSSTVTDNEVVDAYADELKSKLKDILGLTDEEMEELLAQMGLTSMDLFNPDTLINVVLEHFDAASTADALMNENLSSALMDSSKILEEIISKLEGEIIDFDAMNPMGNQNFEEALESTLTKEDSLLEEDSKTEEEKTSSEGKEITVEVNKETEDSKGASFRDDHRGQNEGSNHQESFIDYFANKVDLSSIQGDVANVDQAKQIVTQLVDQIKLNISQTKTSMEMILNPEALGKVQVVVQNKEGVLTAHLNVENELAKNALESSIQTLKESFESQGLKVEKVEVTIGNYSSEYAEQEGQANEQRHQGSKKKINVDDYFEDSNGTNEEASAAPVTHINGTVEYTA